MGRRRCIVQKALRGSAALDVNRLDDRASIGKARIGMQTVALEQSVSLIPDGASLMIGGFMAVGTPERVIDEIVRQNKRELTVIANDTAVPGQGVGKLIGSKLVRKAIVSHIGLNPETQRQMMKGEL